MNHLLDDDRGDILPEKPYRRRIGKVKQYSFKRREKLEKKGGILYKKLGLGGIDGS